MANVHFYLQSGKINKKGQQPIVMRITHLNIRPIFFIGFVVREKHWSQTNEKVKPPKDGDPENNYTIINERISLFRRNAETAIGKALADGIPITEAYLKNSIINPSGKQDTSPKSFFELLDEYISTSKAIRAQRTITGYGTFKGFLKRYETETRRKIDLHSINLKFFDSLQSYAYKDNKFKDNYFAKIIRNLKAFMTWCYKRGYIKDQTYKDFKATEKEKEVIYLTMDELMHLLNFKFTISGRAVARDLYCFMCFTGLRVSDINSLKREHIKDGQIIKTVVKTRQTIVIPLNQFAKTVLSRYEHLENYPLPKLSSQKLNTHIKDCCEEAEINAMVTYVDYSGGKATEFTAPKHTLITNHTARKTFITNSLVLGMNSRTIKDITGNKKDSIFNKYIKISEDFKKVEMVRTWDTVTVKSKE